MTQEEVDLIYDYLHENFEYRDGDFYAKKDISEKTKKGDKFGYFWIGRKTGHPLMIIWFPKYLFPEKKKNKQISLAHGVYIYHFKKKFKYMSFKDGNPTNTRIENLIPEEKRSNCYKIINYVIKPKLISEKNLKCGKCFVVRGERNGEKIFIGEYLNKDIALKAAYYLNELKYTDIPLKKIKEMVLNKYPNPTKKNPKTGFIGVKKYGSLYSAYLFINKVKYRIGKHYETPEEAHQAYLTAKKNYEDFKTIPS